MHSQFLYTHIYTALQLGDIDKPLKLIETWPTLMSRFCKDDSNETPHLYLRRNVFLAVSREKSVRDKEKGFPLMIIFIDF